MAAPQFWRGYQACSSDDLVIASAIVVEALSLASSDRSFVGAIEGWHQAQMRLRKVEKMNWHAEELVEVPELHRPCHLLIFYAVQEGLKFVVDEAAVVVIHSDYG